MSNNVGSADVTYEGPEPLSPAFISFNPMPVQAPLGQRPALSGFDVSPSLFSPISFPYPSPNTPLKSYPDYQDSNTTPPTCGPPLNDFPIIRPPSSTDPACLSCRSPDPTNIHLPGTDFKQSLKYGHTSYHLSEPTFQPNIFGSNVEEIPHEFEPSIATAVRLPSPPISESSSGSDESQLDLIARHLHFDQNSSELLMSRFDRDTCGILSVKDGQSENPWRTMIWPLARSSDSPALYHAIHAMTAFHASKRTPSLQVEGMSHMQRSLHHLRNGIQNMSMCTETALATTLALAFSVSWDQHTLTGSEHLRGASALVDNAIVKYKQSGLHGAEIERLRFLCNTWIYMDVLSRLTTMDGSASSDYENIITPLQGPANVSHEVDPLMGCATTLFPLIGRVANLVREVWRSSTNSVKIISTATDLKEAIKRWAPPTSVEAPEDPDCAIYHSLETAEAYRWATLLYLHQAVPETPSCTSADLALRVLKHLANVPSTSRASIVHIYPLLAAGCEFVDEENRAWVADRWSHMMQRMLIGNIDRCWEVTKEVWRRRDAKMQQEEEQRARLQAMSQRSTGFMVPIGLLKQKNTNSSSSSGGGDGPTSDNNESEARKRKLCCDPQDSSLPERQRTASVDTVEKMDPEKTVKGRLHWLGVMKDWRWEGRQLFHPSISYSADRHSASWLIYFGTAFDSILCAQDVLDPIYPRIFPCLILIYVVNLSQSIDHLNRAL